MSTALEVKVGDWIGFYNPTWRGNRPMSRPAKVIAVGLRIKVATSDPDGELSDRYKLIFPHEVLAIFTSREEGYIRCSAATTAWETRANEIKAIETARDQDVLAALKGN